MSIEQLYEAGSPDVALRHGRMYALRLRDGTILPVQAMNWDPGRTPWQLVEDAETCPEGDVPGHLIVTSDGGFERDEAYEPRDTDRDVRAVAEGLTVSDLVPADDLARAMWAARTGRYASCPRCGGADEAFHHPL